MNADYSLKRAMSNVNVGCGRMNVVTIKQIPILALSA
jgi:hypothetical protein